MLYQNVGYADYVIQNCLEDKLCRQDVEQTLELGSYDHFCGGNVIAVEEAKETPNGQQ